MVEPLPPDLSIFCHEFIRLQRQGSPIFRNAKVLVSTSQQDMGQRKEGMASIALERAFKELGEETIPVKKASEKAPTSNEYQTPRACG